MENNKKWTVIFQDKYICSCCGIFDNYLEAIGCASLEMNKFYEDISDEYEAIGYKITTDYFCCTDGIHFHRLQFKREKPKDLFYIHWYILQEERKV